MSIGASVTPTASQDALIAISVVRTVAEEQEQDHRHKGSGRDQFALERVDRVFDEAGPAEGDGRRGHAGGQRPLHFDQRRFDVPGQCDGVSGGLLLHAQDHGRLAFKPCVSLL